MSAGHRIDIFVKCPDWAGALPDVEAIAQSAAAAALTGEARTLELSLVLAGDAFVQALNRDYRGRDEASNVLAFPADTASAAGEGLSPGDRKTPVLLGDVVVAFGAACLEVESDARGISLRDHLSHLVIHGVLHLLGHDHQTDEQADAMERRETRLLFGLGIRDPYRELVETGSAAKGERHDER